MSRPLMWKLRDAVVIDDDGVELFGRLYMSLDISPPIFVMRFNRQPCPRAGWPCQCEPKCHEVSAKETALMPADEARR